MGFRSSSSSQIYIWIQLEWSGVKLLDLLCKRHTTFARACTEMTKAHHWMYIDTQRTGLGPDVSDGVGACLVSLLKDISVYLRQPRHDTGQPPAATCAIVDMAPDTSKLWRANQTTRSSTDRLCPLFYESRSIYKL